jgi:hypothetical protein
VDDIPDLERCLAYHVLSNRGTWLGGPSLTDLELVLAGASIRATLTATPVAEWRIHGPLEDPEFYLPLVAKTGHPTLTIKWASALEFLHLDIEAASLELLRLIRDWFASGNPPSLTSASSQAASKAPPSSVWRDVRALLSTLARRPGMFLGSNRGWALRCYLRGMADGGDWLDLPALSDLREVIDQIERKSHEAYGSPFAAYRVYDAAPLLAWADIHPE